MNQLSDDYGLTLSNSQDAQDVYYQGVMLADGFDGSGIEQFSQAIEIAPDFALAWAFRAKQQNYYGLIEDSKISINGALALVDKVSERERSLIQALNAALSFRSDSLSLALDHLKKWPLDRFVLSLVAGPFGLYAFSGNADWRQTSLALLESYQTNWPADDWWYLSILAFSKGECGFLDEAEALAENAWELANNANCAHTLAHIHKEQKAIDKGKVFLNKCLANAQSNSDMRHHLVWHLALLEIESKNADSTMMENLFVQELDPDLSVAMPLDKYADNASLLWRCMLNGIDVDQNFAKQTLAYGDEFFPELGFAFADLHRVLIVALIGENQTIDDLKASLKAENAGNYLSDVLTAAVAFTQSDFKQVEDRLSPLLADTVLLGGSNPQRGVIMETYQAAQARL